ncbi:TPA: hypothetical protein NQG29_004108 [Enterobacter cloacae]|nr:hypothetical protein [Enterobacter cloacae]ELV2779195.1 hypothetical protein [Enterobacter cloacae]HAZ4815779.1 hypothetical protein [Enterobacter cloacae]HCI8581898.1 hypothetical protein [Enterobacter cloacae]HCJ0089446.1 hypothetical protein [Enterobacter cloacae]
MSTKNHYQAVIISGPDVTHYGNQERPRKKRRRGLFGLNIQEISIGTLVGLVEQSIHQDLVAWATGVFQAIGFGSGLAIWSGGAFCIALACMFTSWCGSSILSKKSISVGVLAGLVEQTIHAALLAKVTAVLSAIGFAAGPAVWLAGVFCIALPCLVSAAICKLK